MNKYQKGFTLIELLIVIGIIAVLIGVFVTTVNLGRPFEQARDAQRNANVSAIAGAMKSRMADNRGVWPVTAACPDVETTTVLNEWWNIVASTSGQCPGGVCTPSSKRAVDANLQDCLVDKYMLVVPQDPSLIAASNSAGLTGYSVHIINNRVTVRAPFYEGDVEPSITN